MSQEQNREEEFRVDGQQIVDKVKEVVKERRIETQDIKVSGDQLVSKLREILHAGNVRRVILKNSDGGTLLEIPLTLGVAGALILPVWAAVGALAALALDFSITVEKIVE